VHAIVFAIVVVGFPAVAGWLARRVGFIRALGPVLLCYLFGIVLANLPGDLVAPSVSKTAMEASVPLSIPLLLFSTHFPSWMKLAKRTMLAFGLALLSVMIVSTAVAFLLVVPGEESWKVSGMLVGVYTGGTPNMSAIGWALDVQEETFLLLNVVDMLMGAAWFLFLLSLAKKLLGRILPPFVAPTSAAGEEPADDDEGAAALLRQPRVLGQAALGLLISTALLAAMVGLSLAALGRIHEAVVIIGISTGAIAASFVRPIRELKGTYELGGYLILVFCVAIGTQAELGQLLDAGLPYFLYVGVVMFGAIALHLLLCMAFRIDVDTAITTSTAAIYGPAFIGPLARALGNRHMVVSGITAGLAGIAIGNYLGLMLAYLLRSLP
jgi:uncharacterized membrane protein